MSTHNICFHEEIRKISIFCLKKKKHNNLICLELLYKIMEIPLRENTHDSMFFSPLFDRKIQSNFNCVNMFCSRHG